jgi:hypothetical protein
MSIVSLLFGSTVIAAIVAFSALAARSEKAMRKQCGELDGCLEYQRQVTIGMGHSR